jgi:hypothetical protein
LVAVFAAVIYAIRSGYDVRAGLKLLCIALTFEAKDNRREQEGKSSTTELVQGPSAGELPRAKN